METAPIQTKAENSFEESSDTLIELAASRLRIEELEAENSALQKRVEELYWKATIDSDTGLLNREGLKDALEHVDLSDLTVVYIDLDNFKKVNDKFGHKKGDEALSDIAKVLQSSTRDHDIVARVGGDEFVIFAPHEVKDASSPKSHEQQSKAICQRIDESLHMLLEKDPELASVGFWASVGAIPGEDGASYADLIEKADSSMYEKKKENRKLTWTVGESLR